LHRPATGDRGMPRMVACSGTYRARVSVDLCCAVLADVCMSPAMDRAGGRIIEHADRPSGRLHRPRRGPGLQGQDDRGPTRAAPELPEAFAPYRALGSWLAERESSLLTATASTCGEEMQSMSRLAQPTGSGTPAMFRSCSLRSSMATTSVRMTLSAWNMTRTPAAGGNIENLKPDCPRPLFSVQGD
jgi:hypothetical protein